MNIKPHIDRATLLEEKRVAKMARSAHAFVRGNTEQHYRWMSELPELPQGPSIWICGDCHVGNLGPIADLKGRVDMQVRDLDQTTIGNPAHDVVRLALSLASAARSSNLPGVTTAHIVVAVADGYAEGLACAEKSEPSASEPDAVATVRRQALSRGWAELARERLRDVKPTIPLGRKFWALTDAEKWSLGVLLDNPAIKSLVLALNKRTERAKVELVDAAYWMKGCSSLGKLRYAALVRVTGERKDRLSLVDVKEAVPSAAPSSHGAVVPADHAARVVDGARALSPNLGDRMAAAMIDETPVVVRELMPEDLKLEMEQFGRKEAVVAARYLGAVVGKAHGRQMSVDERTSWSAEFTRRAGSDAPNWLWQPVVFLLGRHEAAYLEHCRSYASTLENGTRSFV